MKKKLTKAVYFLFISSLILASVSCSRQPVRLGFIGCLTGKLSDLGISGRNGATLAVERINRSGGIDGRKVELLIRDDHNDKQLAVAGVKDLIGSGVTALIGHMTSSMSLATLPVANAHKVVMISPTTSTNKLSGLDDYFFRILPPNRGEAALVAREASGKCGVTKVVALVDASNSAYTVDWLNVFSEKFREAGGDSVRIIRFSSGKEEISYSTLIDKALEYRPGGILILAGAVDTALLCQQLSKKGNSLPVFPCGWAMTDELLRNGGKAVDGLVFYTAFFSGSMAPAYRVFRREYRETFGRDPDFAAGHAYEAVMTVDQALTRSGMKTPLKTALLDTKTFQGLQGRIVFDKYGDPRRDYSRIVVKNGRFTIAED